MSFILKRYPVPYTGRSSRLRTYFKTHFRIVKTTNEMRQYYACEDQSLIRRARNPIVLWKAWDDVSRHQERNWKRQSRQRRQHGYNQSEIRYFFHVYDEECMTE